METDQGDKGDACLLRSSPSMLTDHNMKMQPISTFSPLPSLSIWPFLLFLPLTFSSWSLHLRRSSPGSLSLSLSFSVLVSQEMKQTVENGLWRNVWWRKKRGRDGAVSTFSCYLHCCTWPQRKEDQSLIASGPAKNLIEILNKNTKGNYKQSWIVIFSQSSC